MRIKTNILYRYESQIEGGTLFIFDLNNYKRYKGKKIEYIILEYISQGLSLEEIVTQISNTFSFNDINRQVSNLITKYIEKNIIEV